MSRNYHCLVMGLLSTAVFSIGTPASAQAEPGEGVQAENFNLSLGLDLGANTNTNLFYEATPSRGLAWSLGVTPKLGISTIDPKAVSFDLDWSATYQQYLSSDEAISAQSGFATTLAAAAHINPNGGFSLRLEEALTRTNEAPNNASVQSIHRFMNTAGVVAGIHPNDRVIQGFVGYHWLATFYNLEGTSLSDLNKDEHAFDGRIAYKFLPQTAAVLIARYSLINYDNAFRTVGTEQIANVDSRPLRITGGLSGLILDRLSVKLLGGYGLSRYSSGDSFKGIIGEARATYFINAQKTSAFSAGYQRKFEDSTLGNFFSSHVIGADYKQMLMNERLALNVGGDFEFRQYNLDSITVPLSNGGSIVLPEQINDKLISLNLGATYSARKWLAFGGGYTLSSNLAGSGGEVIAAPDVPTLDRSYLQNNVSLFARFIY